MIETVDNVYIIMEHASRGQLLQHIRQAGRLPEDEARGLFKQIVCAVKYCHDNGIIHRDLKANNILLDAQRNIRVSDFGLGTRFLTGQELTERCGASGYQAPEFLGQKYDGPKKDVWSLGVLLYCMVTGTLPFKGGILVQLRQQVLNKRYDLPPYLSTEGRNIITQLLSVLARGPH